ncbi:MAG: hypothetical protein AAGA90_19240 [Actinomycetota bacterium]
MRPARILQIWIVVSAAVVTVLLLWSDEEPVCEGPLILDVDTSSPPQCNDPLSGLFDQAPWILVAAAIITAVIVGLVAVGRRISSAVARPGPG